MKYSERFVNLRVKAKGREGTVEFILGNRCALIRALVQGAGDIVAVGFATTAAHPPAVVFTEPYIDHIHQVLVTHRWVPPLGAYNAGPAAEARISPIRLKEREAKPETPDGRNHCCRSIRGPWLGRKRYAIILYRACGARKTMGWNPYFFTGNAVFKGQHKKTALFTD